MDGAVTPDRELQEVLAAIERLVDRHRLLSPEQGLQAARLVTGDPAFEFPARPPATAPPAGETPP